MRVDCNNGQFHFGSFPFHPRAYIQSTVLTNISWPPIGWYPSILYLNHDREGQLKRGKFASQIFDLQPLQEGLGLGPDRLL